jgi:hypothetical protein
MARRQLNLLTANEFNSHEKETHDTNGHTNGCCGHNGHDREELLSLGVLSNGCDS